MKDDSQSLLPSKLLPMPGMPLLKEKLGHFSTWFVRFLSGYYGWLLFLSVIGIFIYEASEHLINDAVHSYSLEIILVEVGVISVLLGLIAYLVNKLLLMVAEKDRALHLLQMKHEFVMRLSDCQDIPSVSKELIQQVSLITPFSIIELYLHDLEKDWFIRAHRESAIETMEIENEKVVEISSQICRECLLQAKPGAHALSECRNLEAFQSRKDKEGYCFPLVDGLNPIGLLVIYRADADKLNIEQIEQVKNLLIEMSITLARVIEKKNLEDARLDDKVRTVQLDIARDLHDTVGQNIGFLRMKLDHLSEKNAGNDSELVMEIRSMSRVANESYDLVRGTLSVLQTEKSADLMYLLSKYAEQISSRSSFTVSFTGKGTPRPMTADRLRHIFYIFREALSNIEKHANASQVDVDITWDNDVFYMTITDDGAGYDSARTHKVDIHFGIKFMRERAALLNGTFNITAGAKGGTQIRVSVPCQV
jgi:signal transduction histidine kinase